MLSLCLILRLYLTAKSVLILEKESSFLVFSALEWVYWREKHCLLYPLGGSKDNHWKLHYIFMFGVYFVCNSALTWLWEIVYLWICWGLNQCTFKHSSATHLTAGFFPAYFKLKLVEPLCNEDSWLVFAKQTTWSHLCKVLVIFMSCISS